MEATATWQDGLPARDTTSSWLRARRLGRLVAEIGRIWLSLRREGAEEPAAQREIRRRSGIAILDALDIEVRSRGRVPAGGGPVLFAANHVSWLDVHVINSADGARFVAKREVGEWPFIGELGRRTGTFFIERGSFRSAARVKEAVAAALRAGERVAVFPEATTTDGTRLARFYPAILQAAIDAGVPVVPVAVRYPTPGGFANPAAAFVGDMTFGESLLRVLAEPVLAAELFFGEPVPTRGRKRREVAATVQERVAAMLRLPGVRVQTKYVPFSTEPAVAREPAPRATTRTVSALP